MESSRIFIRNLPPTITADEFKRHFSSGMAVTDTKLIPSRRIGYVGYETPVDATKAVKYHNKSFIRMSRISVELARSPHELDTQHGLKVPKDTRNNANAPHDTILKQHSYGEDHKKRKLGDKEETRLQEYLDIMQPPTKAVRLADEGTARARQDSKSTTLKVGAVNGEDPGDDEYFTIQKKEDVKITVAPSVAADDDPDRSNTGTPKPPKEGCDSIAITQTKHLADPAKQVASDEDWIRSRTSRTLDLVDDNDALVASAALASPTETNSGPPLPKAKETSNAGAQTNEIRTNEAGAGNVYTKQDQENLHTGRLFVRNLTYKTTEDEIRRLFESHDYGSIEEVHVPVNYQSGSGKGYAYVQYKDPVAAQHSLRELDGKVFQGRLLHILPASSKRQAGIDDFTISTLPLKKQQHIRRRAEATSSTFNWNSMFMNTDAIMSSISDRFGIPKSELLDPTSSDAAVKQAHAETHVIHETKAYFSANGVDLDAFKKKDRGDTALLVKNFPYELKAGDLRAMFSPYGSISKFLVPPSGTIAIVEFDNADQARSAFKSLAYRKIKESILFLEKAPRNLFTSQFRQTTETVVKMPAADLMEPSSDVPGNTSTLFVRNLNFSTTTDRLREIFAPIDGLLSARVKTKPDPKKSGQILSMGFGFLEFRTKQQAQAALAAMDGYNLDGHQLLIRSAHKAINAAEERQKENHAKKSHGRKTKIIIKNLPFEASKKDVRSLFGPYGQLRSVRVPKKFNMSTRGFAFAEFVTPREAENAIIALRDTHLLGRRLVLEFAAEEAIDPEQEIANMQRKVGNQADKVALQQLSGTGRKRFNFGEADAEQLKA